MSDQEDTSTAQAARGGSSSRGARPRREDDRGCPWNRRDFIPADDPGWARCIVKKHEDFPRHIFRLFLLLGIQFRWLLTRGTLGKALVTDAEAAIDDAKERAWSLLSCVTSWKPTTSSLSAFSRPATFLLKTCRMVMLLMLCSRLLSPSCLKPTHLVRTLL